MQPTDIKAIEGMRELLHEVWLIFVPIVILLLGREIIMQWVQGALWRWKGDYKDDDFIKIKGKLARIIHRGILKTKVNEYRIKQVNGKATIVGGWIYTLQNSELSKSEIMKPMESIPDDILEEFDKLQ